MNNKLYNENLLSAGFCEMTDAELESVDGGLTWEAMCALVVAGGLLFTYVNGLHDFGANVGRTIYYKTH